MINISKIQVSTSTNVYIDILWEIETTEEDVREYKFFVYRSESEEGPYILITPDGLIDIYRFRDNIGINLYSNHVQYYYKILVRSESTGAQKAFGPERLGSPIDILALEIARKNSMLLENFTGRLCHIYKLREWGARCPNYDTKLGTHTKSECLDCFNTGFLGGYHRPILSYVQIMPLDNNLLQTPVGDVEKNYAKARLSNYPILSPRDIIIDNENIRWKVQSPVQYSKKLGAVVSQIVTLAQVEKTDISYKLPREGVDYVEYPANHHNYERIYDYQDTTTLIVAEENYGKKTLDQTNAIQDEHRSLQDTQED